MSVKFPVKVWTMNGLSYDSTHDYYDMTEEELENKCCILECNIYFKDTVANSYKCLINERYVTLYDIWNYECVAWWEWPQELKEIMYAKVPKSRPTGEEKEEEEEYTCGEKCECTHCQRNRPTYEEEEEESK